MAKGKSETKVGTTPHHIEDVPISAIDIGPQMIRHDPHDDDIQELAVEIAAHGLMQAIGVSPLPGNRFQLRWGSRRLAAHVRLQRTHIPARIIDAEETEAIVAMAARENLLRRNLTLLEEIDAIRRLHDDGRSPSEISDLVGKGRAWVNSRLAFHQLPADVRDYVIAGDLPLGHATKLANVPDAGCRSYLLSHCLQHRPSLAMLSATIKAIEETPTFSDAIEAGAAAAQSSHATPEPFLACFTCVQPTQLTQLVVVRVCAGCAGALQGCATPTSDATTEH